MNAITRLHRMTNDELQTLADDAAATHHELSVEERDLAARLTACRERLALQERLISTTTEILIGRGAFAAEEA